MTEVKHLHSTIRTTYHFVLYQLVNTKSYDTYGRTYRQTYRQTQGCILFKLILWSWGGRRWCKEKAQGKKIKGGREIGKKIA